MISNKICKIVLVDNFELVSPQTLPAWTFCNFPFCTVDAEITEDEIEKIVSSGQADGVIKEVLINDNMKTVVREIEERHLDILKLEKQVNFLLACTPKWV